MCLLTSSRTISLVVSPLVSRFGSKKFAPFSAIQNVPLHGLVFFCRHQLFGKRERAICKAHIAFANGSFG